MREPPRSVSYTHLDVYKRQKQGFALDTARTLAEAEALWSDGKYDLLVLDVSLPDGSGFDFCQKVRRTSNVPILFLTASDEEMNIIMGLELGEMCIRDRFSHDSLSFLRFVCPTGSKAL